MMTFTQKAYAADHLPRGAPVPRAPIDGAAIRAELIASGAIRVAGDGQALAFVRPANGAVIRLDERAHQAIAAEFFAKLSRAGVREMIQDLGVAYPTRVALHRMLCAAALRQTNARAA